MRSLPRRRALPRVPLVASLCLMMVPLLSGSAAAAPGGVPGPNPNAPGQQLELETATARVPRGNAGTVKVDGAPFDEHPGNEPHVDCLFQVDFYGFHADSASVVFDLQAPTRSPSGADRLLEDTITFADDDEVHGNTLVASRSYDLSDELAASGAEPHGNQGFHVKLSVDAVGTPGGAKHKVFWVSCAPPAPPAPQAGALAVTKTATGQVPGGAIFGFEVACDSDDPAVGPAAFTLGDGDTWTAAGILAGSRCTVTETDSGDADATTVTVAGATGAGSQATVTIAADHSTEVSFTNAFEEVAVDGGSTDQGSSAGDAGRSDTVGQTPPDSTTPGVGPGAEDSGAVGRTTSTPAQATDEGTGATGSETLVGDTSAEATTAGTTVAAPLVDDAASASTAGGAASAAVTLAGTAAERRTDVVAADRGERTMVAAADQTGQGGRLARTGIDTSAALTLALLALVLGAALLGAGQAHPGPASTPADRLGATVAGRPCGQALPVAPGQGRLRRPRASP